jgi:signal transduction histidine kinase
MIVIPLVVSVVTFFGGLHLFATLADLREDRGRQDGRNFMEAMTRIQTLADKWRESPDIEAMTREAHKFNEEHGDDGLALLIYKNGVPVVDKKIRFGEPILDRIIEQRDSGTFFNRTAAHVQIVEDYQVILIDGYRFVKWSRSYRNVMLRGAVVSLIFSVFIVLLTSRFLTQFVFRKILQAMDTLTDGVLQLRDGNLGFRINYTEHDEFTPVCEDFNKMAGRLLESESARQKDEQSRKELIAGISHDLRTPLTSIKAYVEGIEQGVASTPDAQKRYIGIIKDKTDDLEHIIETLFLFSKLDTGEFPCRMERVELSSVASEIVCALSGEYADRGLDIAFAQSSEGAKNMFVNIDAMQLRNVLINIFENSVKYKRKERGQLKIAISDAGKNIVLTLTDDGPGVPEYALDKLFDVFFRIDDSRSDPGNGSGLGLAISQKIVKLFGGEITAANAPTCGLSLAITLPKA